MPYPSPVPEIEKRVQALATKFPAICTRSDLPNRTNEGTGPGGTPGRVVSILRIGTGTGADRPRVLIVAGMHAREWAPPDAVLTFLEKLLAAYDAKTPKPVVYNKVINKQPGRPVADITFKQFTIAAPDVKRIIERVELYVIPCVNPDGRAFSMATPANKGWRKNRRPPGATTCPPLDPRIPAESRVFVSNDPTGVDLNRNFDIVWDADAYVSTAARAARDPATNRPLVDDNTSQCNIQQTWRGPGSGTSAEPETRNVASTIVDKKINFYMDVHSAAGKFLFAWGSAHNQETDPAKTFKNTALNRSGSTGGRDVHLPMPGGYAEWMPPGAEAEHKKLGDAMVDAILDSTGYTKAAATALDPVTQKPTDPVAAEAHERSRYLTVQSVFLFSGATTATNFSNGVSRDFAFSQQIGSNAGTPITARALDFVFSYTFECGRDSDGGFWPDATNQYPKVEREVAAGVAKFLAFAATWVAPVPPPPPAPVPSAPPSSTPVQTPAKDSTCPFSQLIYSPKHTYVTFLRDLRDKELMATRLGARFMTPINTAYRRMSPWLTCALTGRARTRALVRVGVTNPMIALLRLSSWLVNGIERREVRVRYLLALIAADVLIVAGALAAVIVALLGAISLALGAR